MDTKECWLATPKIHFKAISIYTTFGSGQSLTWSSCCFFPLPKNEKKNSDTFTIVSFMPRRRSYDRVNVGSSIFRHSLCFTKHNETKYLVFDHSTAKMIVMTQSNGLSQNFLKRWRCFCCWFVDNNIVYIVSFISHLSHSTNDTHLSVVLFIFLCSSQTEKQKERKAQVISMQSKATEINKAVKKCRMKKAFEKREKN